MVADLLVCAVLFVDIGSLFDRIFYLISRDVWKRVELQSTVKRMVLGKRDRTAIRVGSERIEACFDIGGCELRGARIPRSAVNEP